MKVAEIMSTGIKVVKEEDSVAIAAGKMRDINVGALAVLNDENKIEWKLLCEDSLGMFTVLWCYIRNTEFKGKEQDYQCAADLTGQANHIGVTLQADIVKQKQPECNGGFVALDFGRTHDKVYSELAKDHPIEWTRYQVANGYMGRAGLINSGGASSGRGDLEAVVRSAVINKRSGGMGMITGRKAFQKPMRDGVALLNAVQDVYLCEDVTVA